MSERETRLTNEGRWNELHHSFREYRETESEREATSQCGCFRTEIFLSFPQFPLPILEGRTLAMEPFSNHFICDCTPSSFYRIDGTWVQNSTHANTPHPLPPTSERFYIKCNEMVPYKLLHGVEDEFGHSLLLWAREDPSNCTPFPFPPHTGKWNFIELSLSFPWAKVVSETPLSVAGGNTCEAQLQPLVWCQQEGSKEAATLW